MPGWCPGPQDSFICNRFELLTTGKVGLKGTEQQRRQPNRETSPQYSCLLVRFKAAELKCVHARCSLLLLALSNLRGAFALSSTLA
jgi:hypothetical protein